MQDTDARAAGTRDRGMWTLTLGGPTPWSPTTGAMRAAAYSQTSPWWSPFGPRTSSPRREESSPASRNMRNEMEAKRESMLRMQFAVHNFCSCSNVNKCGLK